MRWTGWRPLKGWRVFWGEVGVIVLGVLIALAAQQAADGWSVRQDTEAARRALRQDFIEIMVNAGERIAEDRCVRRRIDQLAAILDASAAGIKPAVGEIGTPPGRSWYPGSWDSVVGTRVATALPRDVFVRVGTLAQSLRLEDAANARELDMWAQLYRLVGPARPLPAAEAAQLRESLASAAYALNLVRLVAPQTQHSVEETGLPTAADRQTVRRKLAEVLRGPNYRAICGLIGPVPAQRVTAPYDPAIQRDPLSNGD